MKIELWFTIYLRFYFLCFSKEDLSDFSCAFFFFKSFSNISKNKGETFTLGFVLESGRVFTFKAKISTPMKFLKSLKNFVDGLVHVPRYFLNFFQSCAFFEKAN